MARTRTPSTRARAPSSKKDDGTTGAKATDAQVKHAKLDKNKIKGKSGIKSVGFNESNIWASDSDAISVSTLSTVRGVTNSPELQLHFHLHFIIELAWQRNACWSRTQSCWS